MTTYILFIADQKSDRGTIHGLANVAGSEEEVGKLVQDLDYLVKHVPHDFWPSYIFMDTREGVLADEEGEDYYSEDTWDLLEEEPVELPENRGDLLQYFFQLIADHAGVKRFTTPHQLLTLLRKRDAEEAAKPTLSVGTLVYVPGQVKPRPYQAHWAVEDVVPAEKVGDGKNLVTVHPLPLKLHKSHGKYWGSLKTNPKVEFFARTQKDLAKLAAVHVAFQEFHNL